MVTYHRKEEPHPFLDKLQKGTMQRIQVKEKVGFHMNYAFQPVVGEGFITRPIDISPITNGIQLMQSMAEYTHDFCLELGKKAKTKLKEHKPELKPTFVRPIDIPVTKVQARRLCESKGYILPEIYMPEEARQLRDTMISLGLSEIHAGVEPILWEHSHRFMYTGARLDRGYIQYVFDEILHPASYHGKDFHPIEKYFGNFQYSFTYTRYVAFRAHKQPDFYYPGYIHAQHTEWFLEGKSLNTSFPERKFDVLCQTIKPDVAIITAITQHSEIHELRENLWKLHHQFYIPKSQSDTKLIMNRYLTKTYPNNAEQIKRMLNASQKNYDAQKFKENIESNNKPIEIGDNLVMLCHNVLYAAQEQVERLTQRLNTALNLMQIQPISIPLNNTNGTWTKSRDKFISQAKELSNERDKRGLGSVAMQFAKLALKGTGVGSLYDLLREGLSLYKQYTTDARQDKAISKLQTSITSMAKSIEGLAIGQAHTDKTVSVIIEIINVLVPKIKDMNQQLKSGNLLNNLFVNLVRLGDAIGCSIHSLTELGHGSVMQSVSSMLFTGDVLNKAIEKLNENTDKIFKSHTNDIISTVIVNPADNTQLLAIANIPGYSKTVYLGTELFPIPGATTPIRYKPAVSTRYAAIAADGKTYFPMTESQYTRCQFSPCHLTAGIRDMYETVCGPPLLNQVDSSTCTYYSDPFDNKPIAKDLIIKVFSPDGLIYSTNKTVPVRLDCDHTLEFNTTTVEGEGIMHIPKGCAATIGESGEYTVHGSPPTYTSHITQAAIIEPVPDTAFDVKSLLNDNLTKLPVLQDLKLNELHKELNSLHKEVSTVKRNISSQFKQMDAEMSELDETFDQKLDHLDQEVQTVDEQIDTQEKVVQSAETTARWSQIIGCIALVLTIVFTAIAIFFGIRYKNRFMDIIGYVMHVVGIQRETERQPILKSYESRTDSFKFTPKRRKRAYSLGENEIEMEERSYTGNPLYSPSKLVSSLDLRVRDTEAPLRKRERPRPAARAQVHRADEKETGEPASTSL